MSRESSLQKTPLDSTVTVKCPRCDGRGFYKATSRVRANVELPYLHPVAAFCTDCDGRGARVMEAIR